MENNKENRAIFTTIGVSSDANTKREGNDFYATDPIAIQKLLEVESFSNKVWECACGQGHLSEVLKDKGYDVLSTDLVDRGYGTGGVDFFKAKNVFDGDIITNPPYKYATEFARHALDIISHGHKVALFLKIQFLESRTRRRLFDENPPKYIYVSSGRINCCKNGDFSRDSRKNKYSAQAYIWVIWEKGFKGEPTLRWFN